MASEGIGVKRGGWAVATWTTVAMALVGLAGAAALVAGARDEPQPPRTLTLTDESPTSEMGKISEPEAPAATTDGQSSTPDEVTGPVLTQARPTRVTIPSIGVSSPLIGLGLNPDGTMEVPVNPSVAGWYTKGPTPGALGPAVIAGHVTWDQEPAIFYRLSQLSTGDTIEVARKDGKTAVFSVRRIDTFPKSRFPTRRVFGVTDHASLRLITCGGLYDDASNRYLDNVVAFAELVDKQPRGS